MAYSLQKSIRIRYSLRPMFPRMEGVLVNHVNAVLHKGLVCSR
jgi:hypothetical protein